MEEVQRQMVGSAVSNTLQSPFSVQPPVYPSVTPQAEPLRTVIDPSLSAGRNYIASVPPPKLCRPGNLKATVADKSRVQRRIDQDEEKLGSLHGAGNRYSQATDLHSLETSYLVRFVNKEKQRRTALEKGFILDGIAVRTLTGAKRSPKLWAGIPPYNAQRDPHAAAYFETPAMRNLLRRTGQSNGGTSLNGRIVDRWYICGDGPVYLNLRNCSGAGHCQMHYTGHNAPSQLPMLGYNGHYGYRRNMPTLRQTPSAFGEITPFPLH